MAGEGRGGAGREVRRGEKGERGLVAGGLVAGGIMAGGARRIMAGGGGAGGIVAGGGGAGGEEGGGGGAGGIVAGGGKAGCGEERYSSSRRTRQTYMMDNIMN